MSFICLRLHCKARYNVSFWETGWIDLPPRKKGIHQENPNWKTTPCCIICCINSTSTQNRERRKWKSGWHNLRFFPVSLYFWCFQQLIRIIYFYAVLFILDLYSPARWIWLKVTSIERSSLLGINLNKDYAKFCNGSLKRNRFLSACSNSAEPSSRLFLRIKNVQI